MLGLEAQGEEVGSIRDLRYLGAGAQPETLAVENTLLWPAPAGDEEADPARAIRLLSAYRAE